MNLPVWTILPNKLFPSLLCLFGSVSSYRDWARERLVLSVLQPPVRGVCDDALGARDRLAHNTAGGAGVRLGHGAAIKGGGVRDDDGGRHFVYV